MLKKKIQENDYVVGTWCDIPSPAVANVIAKAGLDFIIIDMEHGPADFKLAQEMIMAAEADGCEAIIRVSEINETAILRALDAGASGIIVPHVQSKDDVDKIISFSKYFPEGKRGFNPFIRALGYANTVKTNDANHETLISIIVEDEASIKKLDEIVKNDQVDVVYLGIYDLSVSMGFNGDVKNSDVVKIATDTISRITALGKIAGCMINDKEDIVFYKKLGVKFFVYKVDTAVIHHSYKNILDIFRNAI